MEIIIGYVLFGLVSSFALSDMIFNDLYNDSIFLWIGFMLLSIFMWPLLFVYVFLVLLYFYIFGW